MTNYCIHRRNDYLRPALYVKLIVNNVKYGGIHYDYGQLTKVLFLFLVSLQRATWQDSESTQYICRDRGLNPAFAGIFGKAGCKLLVKKMSDGICRSPLAETISSQSPLNNGPESINLNKSHEMYVCQGILTIQPVYACEINHTSWFLLVRGVKVGFAYDNGKAQKVICTNPVSRIQYQGSSITDPVHDSYRGSIQYPAYDSYRDSIRHPAIRKNSTVINNKQLITVIFDFTRKVSN